MLHQQSLSLSTYLQISLANFLVDGSPSCFPIPIVFLCLEQDKEYRKGNWGRWVGQVGEAYRPTSIHFTLKIFSKIIRHSGKCQNRDDDAHSSRFEKNFSASSWFKWSSSIVVTTELHRARELAHVFISRLPKLNKTAQRNSKNSKSY